MVTSSSRKTTVRSGFSARDVSDFINRGNTSGSNTGLLEGPNKKTGTTTVKKEKNLFKKDRQQTTRTGFFGKFTDKSDAEIDKLINIFAKRRNVIQERKAAPGSSQTRFLGQ